MRFIVTPKERFLSACQRKPVDRPPAWMMRQAGRYLPEYRLIRERMPTLQMMKDPETACEITLQPVRILSVDAAILYSDILILPEAMGISLQFIEGEGPSFANPVREARDVEKLGETAADRCGFVYQTIEKIRKKIGPDFPLIGFAGGPYTVAYYMTREGEATSRQAVHHRAFFNPLVKKLTTATIQYLKKQVEAGVDCIQLFDTWAGSLSLEEYQKNVFPSQQEIITALKKMGVPTIIYMKEASHLFTNLIDTGVDVISVDWKETLSSYRSKGGDRVALQGNLDPAILCQAVSQIEKAVLAMVNDWGNGPGYIMNLGHGISKEVPVAHAKAFIDFAKKYGSRTCHE
ncbi:MAG: uroporphyrinogen decarboxylase [Deltaproteobacteria bacterium]|nr:uroporphyrinogen decarboxylase [Deltaproteobacteria bacterium]